MKRSKKNDDEQLKTLLQQNIPPKPDSQKRQMLIRKLSADAADMDYLEPESFSEKILTTGSYFSPWTWLAFAVSLGLFLCGVKSENLAQAYSYLLCLAPGLTLILLSELSKTFGHNMWEMEAVCRYNLPRLFLMRLTLISGIDFGVMAFCFVTFHRAGGLFWEFALYALLPFFLLSALCLLLMRHLGNRCNRMGLLAVIIFAEAVWVPFTDAFWRFQHRFGNDVTKKVVLCATVLALLFYLGSAVALCTKKYYGNTGKGKIIWN